MKQKHLLLAVLVTAVWGLNFPITKLGLAEINPLLLTALRFTLAALPWVFLVRRPQVAVKWLAAYGLIFGVAMWALINLGIAMGVPPGSASLLIQFSAFFTMGWGVLLFRESLSLAQLISVLLAAVGLAGMLLGVVGTATLLGFALVLFSALAWSIGNIIIKVSGVREIFAFVVWASLFAPLPLVLLTWLLDGSQAFIALPAQLNGVALFSLAFQVYGATHFCYWGWNLLLREYPVSRVAPLSLLIPVFGIVSSMLILGERPGVSQWQAMGLILLALIVGLKKGRPLWVRQDGHA
ncbi:EamA family transporter [Pseudomonas sp. P7779]|uniref:EamA family transporter n=1 Tax=Pseudomonas sp. P7779 TaxID=2738832 RepID=UPI0015B8B2DC|nr:EamA family transporter [Pseudomonas sp. P7779]NWD03041.1 EamA family transporter [Pseudomonas sp. P7779]